MNNTVGIAIIEKRIERRSFQSTKHSLTLPLTYMSATDNAEN